MSLIRSLLTLTSAAVLPLFTAGCQESPTTTTTATPQSAAPAHAHDDHSHERHNYGPGHEHDPGPHGGVVVDWGGGKYHVEVTLDREMRQATVYILGSDEKTPSPVKATDGRLLLTINEPSIQVDLTAQPLDGETDGLSSRYVGSHERFGNVEGFTGTISAEVDGTPYAGDFGTTSTDAH